jgi:hypothetical protein
MISMISSNALTVRLSVRRASQLVGTQLVGTRQFLKPVCCCGTLIRSDLPCCGIAARATEPGRACASPSAVCSVFFTPRAKVECPTRLQYSRVAA